MNGPRARVSAVVIGGGPAGLMAAEVLAKGSVAVTVVEAMPSVGRKLLMAGRGGLNLTHSEPEERFATRYGTAQDWLAPMLADWSARDLVAWCEGLGEPTFVGSSGRVFPRSFKASPLLRAWLARLDALGVTIMTRARWTGWNAAGEVLIATADGVQRLAPDVTVLALGGASWPRLGSDGAWVPALRNAGVDVADLEPANVGVHIDWSALVRERCHGQPLKRIAVRHGERSLRGEAVVTRTGLEGGVIYALGPSIRAALAQDGKTCLSLDLRPDLTVQALADLLAPPRKGATTATVLRKRAGLAQVASMVLREAGQLPSEPMALAALIKDLPLRVTGLSAFERAISSAGGVRRAALNSHLMLMARPGVFVAGEMLDWEAPTGGYLLQGAFSSGVMAARGALVWLAARPAA